MIRPIGNRVLLKEIVTESLVGGIIIPEKAKEEQTTFEVIAVGTGFYNSNGKKEEILDVKAGDVVIVNKFSGNEIKNDTEKYKIVDINDILAIIK